MNYNVIASSSKGNCVIIESVMIDCGIPFNKLKDIDLQSINALLLTHIHGDHLNIKTLQSIKWRNKNIKVFCNSEVHNKLLEHNIESITINPGDIFKLTQDNGININIKAVKLYHDVNCIGYKITFEDFFEETKVFYATDTSTLKGIECVGYDYYFLETNYCNEYINISDMDFNNKQRVINTHLSRQEAENYFIKNKHDTSKLICLHKSSRNYR